MWVRACKRAAIAVWTVIAAVLLCGNLQTVRAQGFQGDSIMTIPGRPGIYRLIGHVKIVHNGNTIYSNYADYEQKTGSCQAYGALRIITKDKVKITGEMLDYNGQTGSYIVDRNVVLDNGKMELKTPALRFEGRTNTAYYDKGGEMTSGQTVMTSKRGYQEGDKNLFHCFDDVIIVHPDYTIWTDTLHYSETDVTRFQGLTNIETTDYYMFGRKGWFDSENDKVSLQRDAYVKNRKSQVLYGDSINYDLEKENGEAFGNVFLLDTARNSFIMGGYARNDEQKGEAVFSDLPHGMLVEQGDTMFFSGDVLRMTYDSAHSTREVFAYHNVKIYREDIQGACDSLVYRHRDSVLYMFGEAGSGGARTSQPAFDAEPASGFPPVASDSAVADSAAMLTDSTLKAEDEPVPEITVATQGKPMVWVQDYQIDGDTIILYMAGGKPSKALVRNNVFVVNEVSRMQGYYNQARGRLMWGWFDTSSQFERADILTSAQSIYYVLDDNNELLGVNKTESKAIKLYFRNNQVYGASVVEPQNAVLYKVGDLTQRQRLLRGFHYEPYRRPLSKYSLSPDW